MSRTDRGLAACTFSLHCAKCFASIFRVNPVRGCGSYLPRITQQAKGRRSLPWLPGLFWPLNSTFSTAQLFWITRSRLVTKGNQVWCFYGRLQATGPG